MAQVIRVFVSSTFLDLEDRRRRVIEAIESFPEMKCVAMERFAASTLPPKNECLELARSADLFVLILAYRYGWIPDGESKSITELEHEAAKAKGIPRLVFIVDERKWPASPDADVDEAAAGKLRAFKKSLADVTPRPFGDTADLVHHVHASVRAWRERHGLESPGAPPPQPEPRDAELSRYREALLDEHRWIRPVGFPTKFRVPMQLDELFVPLRARPRRGEDDKQHGGDAGMSELAFASPAGDAPPSHPLAFEAAARAKHRALVVLGHPGSGKTTLLRRLTNGVLGRGPKLVGLDDQAGDGAHVLPVFVPLRQLQREHCAGGLVDAVAHCLPKGAKLDRGFARWLVEERGRLLVLLDGLDEVRHDLRDDVALWIAGAIGASESSRFVVTSRFAGYTKEIERELDRVALATELQPLDKEQVASFVRNWYAIIERAENPKGAEMRAAERAESLLAELRKPEFSAVRVLEMTANPLLLTAICLVHRDRSSTLPKDRVRLYAEAVDVLLELWHRDVAEMVVQISAEQAKPVLQPVAYFLHSVEGRTDATEDKLVKIVEPALAETSWSGTAQEFLHTIRDESGLLAGLGGDRYGFLHLGFQEYLAARDAQQTVAARSLRDPKAADELLDELADRFGAEWWQEVWLLLLALPDQPRLFEPLFDKVVASPRFVEHELFFSICLRDAKEPPSRQARPFTKFLAGALDGSRKAPPANLIAAAKAALKLDPAFVVARAEDLLGRVDAATAELILAAVRARDPALFERLARTAAAADPAHPRAAPRPAMVLREMVEMVQIPAGKFRMGGTRDSDEKPIHEVTIRRPFWLARTPITNEQYKRFVDATGHEAPESWRDRRFNAPTQPVVRVSWEDARAFCEWLGKHVRMPSEAEWEYACRAGTQTEYSFGDDAAKLAEYAWFDKNSGDATRPVGEKPANPFGLFDMHGNVWEWCADAWHKNYDGAPADGSAWEGGGSSFRVVRGGSWDHDAAWCRSAYRDWRHPGYRLDDGGFRPASSSLSDLTTSPLESA